MKKYKTALRRDIKPGQKFAHEVHIPIVYTALSSFQRHYLCERDFHVHTTAAEDECILCDEDGSPILKEFPFKEGDPCLVRDYADGDWVGTRFVKLRRHDDEVFRTAYGSYRMIAPFDIEKMGTCEDIPETITAWDL